MSFLYFVPQQQQTKPNIDELGLGYIVDQPNELEHCPVLNGPSGEHGVVVGCRMPGRQVLYKPDLQTWRCVAGRWIGWPKDDDFKSEKFKRSSAIDGHTWKDWKGNSWVIPAARNCPRYFGINDDGQFVVEGVQPKYQSLWDAANQWAKNRTQAILEAVEKEQTSFAYEIGNVADVFNTVMKVNYKLSSLEFGLMECITEQSAGQIVELVLNYSLLEV